MAASETSPLHWTNVFRELADQLSPEMAQQLADFRVSDEVQARYDDLADRHTEGKLSDAERAELEEFVMLYRMVRTLKARARAGTSGQVAA